MANDLKQSVLSNLRSVTQSCKGGVPFSRLMSDYQYLIGSPIPFKEFGHNSLESFIRSIPDVISLKKNQDGQLVAEGVADDNTAHIVSMVKKQRDTRKKISRRPPFRPGMRNNLYTQRAYHGDTKSHYPNYPARNSRDTYVSPKHESSKPVLSKSAELTSYSKSKSYEQVPPRKYEVPPRFSNLHKQKSSSPPPVARHVSSPTPAANTFVSDECWDSIPAPLIPSPQVSRSLPSRPRRIENTQSSQLSSLEDTKTAKEFIEVYCKMNKIKPEYKTSHMGQKAKSKGYISTLCLGDSKYNSYPNMKSTVEAAEEEAASYARTELKKMEEKNTYSETPYSTAGDIQVLLSRIEEIVCEKPSGMFENGIVDEYENKFHERLPSCWSDLLKQSSFIEIDAVCLVNGKVPKGANFIVRPTKELSSGNRTPSSTSSKTEVTHDDLDTGMLKKNLVDISYPKVPDIVLPSGNFWDVFVTNVMNSVSVRFIEYDGNFSDLRQKMSDFYKIRNEPVTEVLEYHMYAARDEDDPDFWHRVLVDSIEDDCLCCYFVDVGEFLYVKKEILQEINPSFLKLPFQAVHISLDGFEGFDSCIELFEENICGRILIAEVKRSRKNDEFFPLIPGIHRQVHTVVLYDTESQPGVDMNLNELFMESLKGQLFCQLPKVDTSCCGYLSHVTLDGHIYLRFSNPLNCFIEKALESLSLKFEEVASSNTEIPVKAMCAAKYESKTWHRAVVYNQNDDMFEVLFVDYGHKSSVKKSEICLLEPISKLLASFTHQALHCELWDALPSPTSKWTDQAIHKLLELAPFEQELIVAVMNEDDPTSPKVNLFKRDQEDVIVSINFSLKCNSSLFGEPLALALHKPLNSLSLQPTKSTSQNTLFNAIPDVAVPAEQMAKRLVGSNSSDELKWLNTPDDIKSPDAFDNQSSLEIVSVPAVGSYFDVFITMAANPHNFFLQPLSSYKKLNEMMVEMGQLYSAEFADGNQLEMDISMLQKSEFYAALHSDGSWYRIQIKEIVYNSVSVIAYYVDFGDYQSVSLCNIQPLYKQFKSLPCQAVRASLHGIKPLQQDWDSVHCVEFKNIVTEQIFVSIIHKKMTEENDGIQNLFLELTLIDTSVPEKDVYIHELLIEKNMAMPV